MTRNGWAIIVLLTSGLPVVAGGTVKFALASGASCNLCHVSPLGGGMRNSYGFEEVILGDLTREGARQSIAKGFTTGIGKFLRWGIDARLQGFRYGTSSARPEALSGIFPMQATAYVHVSTGEALDFYIAHFLLQRETEYWVRLARESEAAYVRVGRFRPAYGIRLDDHTSYIRGGNTGGLIVRELDAFRQGLPFGPRFHGGGTVEGGLYLGAVYLAAHAGSPSLLSSPVGFAKLATAKDAQLGLRLEVMQFLGRVTLMAGGSYLREREPILRGVFGGLNWRGLTLLGEVDWVDGWEAGGATSQAVYGELDLQVRQGWRLFVKVDDFDANTAAGQENDTLRRWTLGGEFFVRPLVELKPQIRYNEAAPLEDAGLNLLLQLHVFI
ncbi:MAG: hypothetical protein V3U35_01115 [Candidatus Neomarinimicrobiota bacterium]